MRPVVCRERSSVRVELPWPDKRLSPNSRTHWRPKSEAAYAARNAAMYLCLQAIGTQGYTPNPRPSVSVVFHPPTRARRDLDNCIASLKSAADGIADALCVDDSNFRMSYQFGEVVKCGRVVVEIAG